MTINRVTKDKAIDFIMNIMSYKKERGNTIRARIHKDLDMALRGSKNRGNGSLDIHNTSLYFLACLLNDVPTDWETFLKACKYEITSGNLPKSRLKAFEVYLKRYSWELLFDLPKEMTWGRVYTKGRPTKPTKNNDLERILSYIIGSIHCSSNGKTRTRIKQGLVICQNRLGQDYDLRYSLTYRLATILKEKYSSEEEFIKRCRTVFIESGNKGIYSRMKKVLGDFDWKLPYDIDSDIFKKKYHPVTITKSDSLFPPKKIMTNEQLSDIVLRHEKVISELNQKMSIVKKASDITDNLKNLLRFKTGDNLTMEEGNLLYELNSAVSKLQTQLSNHAHRNNEVFSLEPIKKELKGLDG